MWPRKAVPFNVINIQMSFPCPLSTDKFSVPVLHDMGMCCAKNYVLLKCFSTDWTYLTKMFHHRKVHGLIRYVSSTACIGKIYIMSMFLWPIINVLFQLLRFSHDMKWSFTSMPAYIVVITTTFRGNEEVGFIPIYRPHGESNGWRHGSWTVPVAIYKTVFYREHVNRLATASQYSEFWMTEKRQMSVLRFSQH